MIKKDFITIKDLTAGDINGLFLLTDKVKKTPAKFYNKLYRKTFALIFQKPSNRTRVSFEVGANQLGANCIYLGPQHIEIGKRESVKDVARVLSRYVDAIIARTYSHKDILDLADNSSVPVINGLSDLLHPCQAMADIYTIREARPRLSGVKLAYVGDGNNVLHSLLYACSKVGINLSIANPKGYEPNADIVRESLAFAKKSKAEIHLFNDPVKAVKDADIIYTDVWASMGQEKTHDKRVADFKGFQVDKRLLKQAKGNVLFMHCLPAHRGEEVTDDVLDGKHSLVYDQAENRLHMQKAILLTLLGKGAI